MSKAMGDDDRARRAIYEEHAEYVRCSLRRFGVAPGDVEDLCHDVFVVHFFGATSYDPNRPLRPWLLGVALRVAADHRRRARFRREVMAPVAEPPCPSPPVDETIARGEDRRLVERALYALDRDQRAVFVRHELDERPMPEIARSLDAPLNTLYSRLRLGRRKFVAAVQRLAGEGARLARSG